MKKSLTALAVLAAASAASAQSSVTIFGVADVAYTRVESDLVAGSVSRNALTTGANRTSRIGFRGIEDLGGGLKAGFWLEAGISIDDGSGASTRIYTNNQANTAAGTTPGTAPVGGAGQGLTFNRRATVSLIGNFGEVRFGRDSVAGLLALQSFDPFVNVGVGSIRQIVYANARVGGDTVNISSGRGQTVRASNMVEYFLPSDLGGFNGTIAYAFGENSSNATISSGVAPAPVFTSSAKSNGQLATARIGYLQGPFDISLAGTQYKFRLATGLSNDFTEYTLGGSYDFKVVKLYLAYHSNKVDNFEAKTDSVILSGTAPLGPGLIRAIYVNASQKGFTGNASGNDGSHFAIGYVYNLSKRTSLYTTYAVADNKGTGTRFTVGGGLAVTRPGGKSTGFNLGISHGF